MKKLFALLAVALGVVACQKDHAGMDVNMGGEQEVMINVSLPEETRANSADGGITNVINSKPEYTIRYIFQVWNEDFSVSKEKVVKCSDDTSVAFPVRLVPGRTYNFVVWADIVREGSEADLHYNTTNLKAITLNGEWNAMDETRDAYTVVKEVKNFNSGEGYRLTLTRPFAKLRVITTDMLELLNLKPEGAEVEYTTVYYNQFDATTGNISTERVKKTHTFEYKDVTAYEDSPKTDKVLFVDYIFAKDEVVNFNMSVNMDDGKAVERSFTTDIPVKRNHLTTIKGDILTDGNNIVVNVEEGFQNGSAWDPEDDQYDIELWDGLTTQMPSHNGTDLSDATEIYVDRASELAWLADAVNNATRAAGNTFKGKTIVLHEDINLNNEPWTPIGNSTTNFEGTFDGNGKTIYNLIVNGYENNAGLFGVTSNGEIKNLVIENAKVSGRLNVGVVAGTPYTSKYTNITVKGHVEVNGMAYVGGVGGKNAYANWENINVAVDETSYVNANSIEDGVAYRTYVGGVVGFNGEGGHSFKNITSNINVSGSTIDVGGLFGIAHYGNKFENCSCSGNVEIYAAEEAEEAEEIGGIAGVWHNCDNTSVTMTNVEFTGEVTTNIERNTVWYGNLVGKYYAKNDLGELTLNGLKFTRNGVNFAEINAILESGEYTLPFDLTGSAKATNGYGVTGINHGGFTLNGNSHTLKVNALGTWDSAIATKGGTIKNITIAKGFRGIFIKNGTERVILENVTIDGPTYTISCDAAGKQGITATKSVFNGWTSYAGTIGDARFEGCSFGEGAGYKFARPYAPTTFVDCDFCEGYKIDARAKVTFINCRVNGVELTPANYTTLVTSNQSNAEFTTEDGKPIVADASSLNEALKSGNEVVLAADIAVKSTETGSNGYGAAGISQLNGGTIDGNGNDISVNAWGTWDSAINTTGGTIKNLNVTGGMRGIFVNHNSTNCSKVILENVTIDGTVYTISCDQGTNNGLEAINSTFNGWTSYAATIGDVKFTNCNFGEGQGYAYCRPYAPTEFVGCNFAAGFEVDARGAITFENCTIGGVALTAENLATLVTGGIENASVK